MTCGCMQAHLEMGEKNVRYEGVVVRGRDRDARRPSARELLDDRFVRGELPEEEYARKRAAMNIGGH